MFIIDYLVVLEADALILKQYITKMSINKKGLKNMYVNEKTKQPNMGISLKWIAKLDKVQ